MPLYLIYLEVNTSIGFDLDFCISTPPPLVNADGSECGEEKAHRVHAAPSIPADTVNSSIWFGPYFCISTLNLSLVDTDGAERS